MNTYDIATALDGIEYPCAIPKHIQLAAQVAKIVIVYGMSDDLVELAGAICDELCAYGGADFSVTPRGLMMDFDNLIQNHRGADLKDKLREYFQSEGTEMAIEALWCDEPDISWTFRTTIPHQTFRIMEDGAVFCRGIVFALGDVKP